ncbi:MAG: lipopolysaccharide biosynthesis protein RfbH, partial [Halanaerobiales bacterium]|nr:lipopolysaccharide biosynthesis protein RfbH [Halanaerobiales bacterium]
MTDKEKKIKEAILKKVRELYLLRRENSQQFRPGHELIPFAGRIYDQKEMMALVNAALEFWLTAGKNTVDFEQRFAEFLGVKYCSLVNSGSSANLLALTALTSPQLGERRLQPGDEVITVAAAFPTTVNPIVQNGLVPVFVDVDLGTYNINIKQLQAAVTAKTKAIILAHTLGNPFNLGAVLDLAQKHRLYLIEDSCDALGSTYQDRLVGTFGDAATFSFYPAHQMTMGEGGAILAKSRQLDRIIRSLRDWGRDCFCQPGMDNTCGRRFNHQLASLPEGYDHKYIYSHLGYNLKVLDLQPAIGLEQLKKLPFFIEKRKENFKKLQAGLLDYQ